MAERATVNQSVQIGVETTPGTAVPANKLLSGLAIELLMKSNSKAYRPTGQKMTRLAVLEREWTEGTYSGPATFNELTYIDASIIRKVTPTTPSGGTLSRLWTFDWNNFDADLLAAYTIEQGGSVRAQKAAGCQFMDRTFKVDRKAGVDVNGKILGKVFTDGITMTATPAELALVPITPSMYDVFLDTTGAGLGTTKMLRFMGLTWTIASRVAGNWPLDSAQPSWAAAVESEGVKITGQFSVQADATGMAMLTQARAGLTKFLRLIATGPVIEAAIHYVHQLDLAFQIMNPIQSFKNDDGSYDAVFDFETVYDPTWGYGFRELVTNTVTAL
jgi:hypothetical protein